MGCLALSAASATAQHGVLFEEIQALVDTVETASWVQTSWERMDGTEESTSARCLWAGQGSMRLDVFAGKGKGATAILSGGRVHGYKRGLLSFLKRSFDPSHRRVRSLRGNLMSQNGFMDDLIAILAIWNSVSSETLSPELSAVHYVDSEGLNSTLHIERNPIRVVLHERTKGRRLVERYVYSDIQYNVTIDADLLLP